MEFKEVLNSSGMSLKQFSELFNIPYRTVQDWNASKRTPPEYVLNLIIDKLNEKKEQEIGVIIMKKITIFEYQVNRHNGDSFSEYAYSLEEIQNIARKDGYTLTDSEKRNSDRYILGHDLIFDSAAEIPEKAEQLDTELHNGDIEAEGFDICTGYTDNNQSYFEEINE